MKTTIDNNQRGFLITTSTGKTAFCNLSDLNATVKEMDTREDYFSIFHFWNAKPKKVSKKYLREFFEANQLKQEFYY